MEERGKVEERGEYEERKAERMMEERWEMICWVTGYISRNQERWEVEM